MRPIEGLLYKLEGLRKNGDGKWTARCPAHDDRTPSLNIRELDDGKVLLKCWAGCSIEAIVKALGLHLRDLFPGDALPSYGPSKRAIVHERFVYEIGLALIAKGQQLSATDQTRFELSRKRLERLS